MPTTPGEDEIAAIRARLERAVASVCPGWLADRRDDLVQAATIRVLDLCRRGEGNARLGSSYLWRVAYRALVDEIRRIRRRREQPLEETRNETLGSTTADPETETYGRELGRAIQSCLQTLVPPRRRAVTLYLQGHNVPEAARLLGAGRKRVENLVYRGLANLRRCLEGRGIRWKESR